MINPRTLFAGLTILLPILTHAQNSPIFVSDLDDTIKITNVQSIPSTIYNGIIGERYFAGMNDLYQALVAHSLETSMEADPFESLVIVSASPNLLMSKTRDDLHDLSYPPAQLFFRRTGDLFHSVQEYKIKTIQKLIHQQAQPLVLIGDDSQQDPETYAALAEAQPQKILARYIRAIKNRTMPDALTQIFYSAFDLALHELNAGRLHTSDVLTVGQSILNTKKSRRIFPSYATCPKEPISALSTLSQSSRALTQMAQRIQERFNEICINSRSDFE